MFLVPVREHSLRTWTQKCVWPGSREEEIMNEGGGRWVAHLSLARCFLRLDPPGSRFCADCCGTRVHVFLLSLSQRSTRPAARRLLSYSRSSIYAKRRIDLCNARTGSLHEPRSNICSFTWGAWQLCLCAPICQVIFWRRGTFFGSEVSGACVCCGTRSL